ncbi:MAG TPA: F0F1 ATP synthase subunit B [Gammaproteobacteria bacterium]|nr:F0F1 ATP synthase subunit B [Gammaproteobacteria bacterium]
MNINATLLGQMITFLLFVLFTKRYVWPYLQNSLRERQEKIAEGLAAAERGHHDLVLAQEAAVKKIKEGKEEASRIIEEAKKQATHLIEIAKQNAITEADRLRGKAQVDIEHMVTQAQETLRRQAAKIAVLGAEKILARQIDEAANQELLEDLVREI